MEDYRFPVGDAELQGPFFLISERMSKKLVVCVSRTVYGVSHRDVV